MKIRMMLVMFFVLAMTPAVFAQTTIRLFDATPVTTSPSGGYYQFGERVIYLSCPSGATSTLSGPLANGGLIANNFIGVFAPNICPVNVCPGENGLGSCFSGNSSLATSGAIENTFSPVAPIDISYLLTEGVEPYRFDLLSKGVTYGNTSIDLTTTCTQVYPVCHRNNGKKEEKTIYVDSLDSVAAHVRNHGDTPAPCASGM